MTRKYFPLKLIETGQKNLIYVSKMYTEFRERSFSETEAACSEWKFDHEVTF